MQNLERIRQIAVEQMKERKSHEWKERGNKFYHGERVARLALTLRDILFPGDDSQDDILTVAAWFHDIRNGEKNHSQLGAELTRELLNGLCAPEELDTICGIIEIHDDRKCDRERVSTLAKLHQDADNLDHFGTFEIWSKFIYVISHDMNMSDAVASFLNGRCKKTGIYRAELNFELSRRIFDEKTAFMYRFMDRLAAESSGEIWNIDRIIDSCRNGAEIDVTLPTIV